MSNKKSIIYRRIGDYNIPNLILPSEEVSIRLGKWGMMHKDYLFKHKKVVFMTLLTQGKLYQHCAEEENQLEWVCGMQNIEARAREIVNNEIIFN